MIKGKNVNQLLLNQIDNDATCEKIILKAESTAVLPYKWLRENKVLGVLCKIQDSLVPQALIENLVKLYTTTSITEISNSLQSKLIHLEYTKEQHSLQITFDIQGFSCNKISRHTPLQLLCCFNPPLTINNALPKPLEIKVILRYYYKSL